MIVGTAGHIDHGKTTLVHALTGQHTSRLAEERRRGITIELGYAYFDTPTGNRISFVDVPGHEKFVRTMVAGATGIDFALLLVAADDGVMPQTREHFAVLQWLGIGRGAIVITKIDRADDEQLRTVHNEVLSLVAGTLWSTFPVHATSAESGAGIAALKDLLVSAAIEQESAPLAHTGFRLNLDRVFTLDGVGTVVAGSVQAGSVGVGANVCLAHRPAASLRVRSLSAHGKAVDMAGPGQRCAVGVHGLDRSDVDRGHTLCDPRIAVVTNRVDVWLHLAIEETAGLRSGASVHLHCGTHEVMASVVLLGNTKLDAGEADFAQLVLRSPAPLAAWHGDRFVLRDASAERTIGGGRVLDPFAPARYRQAPERLLELEALTIPDARESIVHLLADSPLGLDIEQVRVARGWIAWPFALEQIDGVCLDAQQRHAISTHWRDDCAKRAAVAVLASHDSKPDEPGIDSARLRRMTASRMNAEVWALVVAHACATHELVNVNGFIASVSHREKLDSRDRVIVERALPILLAGAFDPLWVRSLAVQLNVPEEQMRGALLRLAKSGGAHQITKDLFYHPTVVGQLAKLVRDHVDEQQQIRAKEFRDLTGLGRHRAIQILEFFDRIGLLRRNGDAHLLRTDSALFSPADSAPPFAQSRTPQREAIAA